MPTAEQLLAQWQKEQRFRDNGAAAKVTELKLANMGFEIVLGRRPPDQPHRVWHLRELDDAGTAELVRVLR